MMRLLLEKFLRSDWLIALVCCMRSGKWPNFLRAKYGNYFANSFVLPECNHLQCYNPQHLFAMLTSKSLWHCERQEYMR